MGQLQPLWVLLVMLFPLTANSTDWALFSQLEGHWLSQDDSGEKRSLSVIHVGKDLGGKFYRLDYRFGELVDGRYLPGFHGKAHYRVVGDCEYEAYWVDNSGDLLNIAASCDAATLVARWGSEQAQRGETRYQLVGENAMLVVDRVLVKDRWQEFSRKSYNRQGVCAGCERDEPLVSGIGGIFFRGADPRELTRWYRDMFGIDPPPSDYQTLPWRQQAGFTVFGVFSPNTDYFGDPDRQWMLNLRVNDLEALTRRLRAGGMEVSEPEVHPNGRFARTHDPEGNPVELWEPAPSVNLLQSTTVPDSDRRGSVE